MTTYTIELHEVMRMINDPGDGSKLELGAGTYPIYDETERVPLNKKIIDHFWLREIGQETIARFTFMLGRTMREVMPLYNQLYLSARIEFDPLATYNLSTIRDGTATENATGTSTGHNSSTTASASRSVSSSTPQTQLAGDEDYATGAADANSNTTVSSDSTGTSGNTGATTQNDTSRTTGFQGSAADLLNKYRSTILNIDMNVIHELDDCFMLVWGNPNDRVSSNLRGY